MPRGYIVYCCFLEVTTASCSVLNAGDCHKYYTSPCRLYLPRVDSIECCQPAGRDHLAGIQCLLSAVALLSPMTCHLQSMTVLENAPGCTVGRMLPCFWTASTLCCYYMQVVIGYWYCFDGIRSSWKMSCPVMCFARSYDIAVTASEDLVFSTSARQPNSCHCGNVSMWQASNEPLCKCWSAGICLAAHVTHVCATFSDM